MAKMSHHPTPRYDLAAIKRDFPLLEVVERDLGEPKRAKNNTNRAWVCPFHADKTPSLSVNVEKNVFHCFGCDARGSVIDWTMLREGIVGPHEAADRLTGGNPAYQLNPTDGAAIKARPVRTAAKPLRPVKVAKPPSPSFAAHAPAIVAKCEETLWSGTGRVARNMLLARGLTPETLKAFHIGYNPHRREGLIADHDGCIAHVPAGIVIPWLSGGKLLGMKIRRDDGDPKYWVVAGSADPPLYMADTLKAKRAAVVCEGELDALMVWQAVGDVAGVVSITAGAATWEDAWTFRLLTVKRVVALYDCDESGTKGRERLRESIPRTVFADVPNPDGRKGFDVTDYAQDGGDIRALLMPLIAPEPSAPARPLPVVTIAAPAKADNPNPPPWKPGDRVRGYDGEAWRVGTVRSILPDDACTAPGFAGMILVQLDGKNHETGFRPSQLWEAGS